MGDGRKPGAHHRSRRVVLIHWPRHAFTTAVLALFLGSAAPFAPAQSPEKPFPLPFLGDAARERGIELPLPIGVGLVYYGLHRAIEVTDVRVGRNGAPPASVSQFVQFASKADVTNLNVKVDAWIFPFLNVYAILGGVWNQSTTNLEVTLPPLRPGGEGRQHALAVPAELNGTVGGLGLTLAGGYRSLFAALDVNAAQADLGFDERFHAVITSLRAGWHGKLGTHPARVWLNGTYWKTFATIKGSVADPDGGTLAFEVDQGPLHPYTYGAGFSYGLSRRVDLSADYGADFHGGWYVALVPVYRF